MRKKYLLQKIRLDISYGNNMNEMSDLIFCDKIRKILFKY